MTDLHKNKYTLLTGVKIYERNNEVRDLHLDYSPFSNKQENYTGPRLDAIWEQFGSDNRQDIYKFTYRGGIIMLPPANSNIQDHWGYFNVREEYVSCLPFIDDGNIQVHGHNKRPAWAQTIANTLQAIHLGNGEKISYNFELNDVYHVGTDQDQPFGGLRIKSIQKSFGYNRSPQIWKYEYKKSNGQSSGKAFQEEFLYHNGQTVFSKCISNIYDFGGKHISYSRVTEILPNGSKVVYNFDENTDCADPIFNPSENTFPSDYGYDRLVRLMSPPTSYFWRRGLLTSKEIYSGSTLVEKETYEYTVGNPVNIISCYTPQFIRGGNVRINIYKWVSEPLYLRKSSKTVNAYGPLSETIFEYNNETRLQPLSVKTTYSTGDTYETRIKYCNSYNLNGVSSTGKGMTNVLATMLQKRAFSIPIEKVMYKNRYIVGGTTSLYTKNINNIICLKQTLNLQSAVRLISAEFKSSTVAKDNQGVYVFTYDSHYKPEMNYDEYDNEGLLLSSHPENGNVRSLIYGYDNTVPIAQIENAVHSTDPTRNEVIYNGFENGSNILKLPTAKSGDYVLSGYYEQPLNVVKPGKYIVSYWRKLRTPSSRSDWEYVEFPITINATTPPLVLTSSPTYVYDELRIMPEDAFMTTYTYQPGMGITSEVGPNGIAVYYEYNKFKLLKAIKDNDGKIVKKIIYDNYTSNL